MSEKQKVTRLRNLVVFLRCEWCKELFPWTPKSTVEIEKRLRTTCSSHCGRRLREWNRYVRDWNQYERAS